MKERTKKQRQTNNLSKYLIFHVNYLQITQYHGFNQRTRSEFSIYIGILALMHSIKRMQSEYVI